MKSKEKITMNLNKIKQICKKPQKREYRKRECKPLKTHERKFAVCGSVGKKIGNIGFWVKACGFYSENR
jgi:hypothetical protein